MMDMDQSSDSSTTSVIWMEGTLTAEPEYLTVWPSGKKAFLYAQPVGSERTVRIEADTAMTLAIELVKPSRDSGLLCRGEITRDEQGEPMIHARSLAFDVITGEPQ
ncbi:hypothetical protein [Bifidobacterium pseudolongum]|uniref:hypothetical protein n=1 Tax=Bifidobacterium pseudolongum TaxID=1694 RepID=UPI001020ED17|nr:hypothetical protein [Bifidobacterium pseudolongum]